MDGGNRFPALVIPALETPLPAVMYLGSAVLCLAGILLITTAVTISYNIFFHELRQYPGPFLARASGLWGFYLNLQGRRAHEIVKAHQRYGRFPCHNTAGGPTILTQNAGRVVRVAPNLLSFSKPQAVREIYLNPNFTKASRFYVFEPQVLYI